MFNKYLRGFYFYLLSHGSCVWKNPAAVELARAFTRFNCDLNGGEFTHHTDISACTAFPFHSPDLWSVDQGDVRNPWREKQ